MKQCGKCREMKELSEFHVCRSNKDGLQGYCKVCNREQKWLAYRGGRDPQKPWAEKIVGYHAAHDRVRYTLGLASDQVCVDTGLPAHDWSYIGGDPDEVYEIIRGSKLAYSLKPEYYVPRTKKAHKEYDREQRKGKAA